MSGNARRRRKKLERRIERFAGGGTVTMPNIYDWQQQAFVPTPPPPPPHPQDTGGRYDEYGFPDPNGNYDASGYKLDAVSTGGVGGGGGGGGGYSISDYGPGMMAIQEEQNRLEAQRMQNDRTIAEEKMLMDAATA